MAVENPISDVLREAIRESGLPLLRIEKETGVQRASLSRFLRDERSLRLDMADKLAAYYGLRLAPTEKKTTTKKPAAKKPEG
jgi:plasmid maintenance system antidote protein VapI